MLIELMIALTISFLVLAALLEMYLGSQRSYKLQTALSDIQYNATSAIAFLTADIQAAGGIGCQCLSADFPNEYSIEKTKQKNSDGSPNYALFKRDIKHQ